MEFKAFISYKHAVSTDFASDLELHVKKYAKGPLKKPDKIFRDEQYLEVGGDLSELIKKALRKSEFLILIASPEAAKSPWVLEELKIWCNELKRADRIIIILSSGVISVDEDKKKINWKETNSLPPFLKDHLPVLPLFVDLSWAIHKKERNLSNQSYKNAINSIVAKIRGVSPNALSGIEWKIRRRNLRIAWSFSLALVFLLVIVTIGLLRLDRINSELEVSINRATSRELAAKSQLQELPEQLITASKAVDTDSNNESINSLLTNLSDNQSLVNHILQSADAIECLGSTEGSNNLYTIIDNQLLIFNNIGTENKVIHLPETSDYRDVIYYSPDKILAISNSEIWDVQTGKILSNFNNGLISAVASETLNNQLFVGQANGSVFSVDILSGKKSELYAHKGQVTDLSVGDTFIISTALSSDSPVIYYSLLEKKTTEPPEILFSANAVDVSKDYSSAAIAFENGEVGLFSLPAFDINWMETVEYSASEVSFRSNGRQIAAGNSAGEVVIFDINGSPTDSWQAVKGGVWKMAWVQDRLFSGGSDGWIRSWKPNQLLVPGKTYRSVNRFFWNNNKLFGIDSNRIYDLFKDEIVDTIADLSSDEIIDINKNGIVTKYQGKLYFYDSLFNKTLFPEEEDSLRVISSVLSADGNFIVSTWWPKRSSSQQFAGGISVWNINSNTVEWLESVPEFPNSVSLFNTKILAVYGRGSVFIWDFETGELITKSKENLYEPIEELAFLNKDNLVLGHLMGKIEIVSVRNVDSTLYSSELPVGSIYGLEIADGRILSIDIDGLKWFDHELNYLGTIINTSGHRSMPSEIKKAPHDNIIGVRLRSGEVMTIKLDIAYLSQIAKEKSKVCFSINE